MKKFITPAYTFTPWISWVWTINLSWISWFDIKKLVSIINQTKWEVIYSTASTTLWYTNLAWTTLTLNKDTSTHSNIDVLQVIYETETESTSAKQDDIITALVNLLTELQLKANLNEVQPVSWPLTDTELRATPLNIDKAWLSTDTLQSALNWKIDTLNLKDFATETTLAQVLAKLSSDPATQTTLVAVLNKLISNPATDTLQTAWNSKLDSLLTELQLKADLTETQPVSVSWVSTEAKQDTQITSLNAIDTSLNNIETKQTDWGQKTQIVDSLWTSVTTLWDWAWWTWLWTSIIATNFVSSVNSTNVQLASWATYTWAIETILNQQSISMLITSDQNWILTLNQYIDNLWVYRPSSWQYEIIAWVPFSRSFTANGNYFNLTFKNTWNQTTTTLNINTFFGTLPASTNKWNLPVSLEEVKGQDLWRTTFSKVRSWVDPDYFNTISTWTWQAVNQSAWNLVITSWTTANAETILRSIRSFSWAFQLKAQTILSQRIINNNFFVEMVDVIWDWLTASASSATSLTVTIPNNSFTSENVGQSMYIGNLAWWLIWVPNRYTIASVSWNDVTFTVAWFSVTSGTCSLWGWNYHHIVYDGAVATNAKYDSQRKGWNSWDTTLTINTSASPWHLVTLWSEDWVWYVNDQLVASSWAPQQASRGSRVVNLADEKANLYLQIRVLNGSTNPASTTTWTIWMVWVESFTNQQVSINRIKWLALEEALQVAIASWTVTTVSTVTWVSTLTNQTSMWWYLANTQIPSITNTSAVLSNINNIIIS